MTQQNNEIQIVEQSEQSEQSEGSKEEKVEIAAKCRGPGPAKYLLPGTVGIKCHDIRKHRCPAFSFGQRHKEFSSSFSPGPKYMFPAYVTRKGKETSPAFSLYSRAQDKLHFHTPGPGSLTTCNYNIKKHVYHSCYFTGSTRFQYYIYIIVHLLRFTTLIATTSSFTGLVAQLVEHRKI